MSTNFVPCPDHGRCGVKTHDIRKSEFLACQMNALRKGGSGTSAGAGSIAPASLVGSTATSVMPTTPDVGFIRSALVDLSHQPYHEWTDGYRIRVGTCRALGEAIPEDSVGNLARIRKDLLDGVKGEDESGTLLVPDRDRIALINALSVSVDPAVMTEATGVGDEMLLLRDDGGIEVSRPSHTLTGRLERGQVHLLATQAQISAAMDDARAELDDEYTSDYDVPDEGEGEDWLPDLPEHDNEDVSARAAKLLTKAINEDSLDAASVLSTQIVGRWNDERRTPAHVVQVVEEINLEQTRVERAVRRSKATWSIVSTQDDEGQLGALGERRVQLSSIHSRTLLNRGPAVHSAS